MVQVTKNKKTSHTSNVKCRDQKTNMNVTVTPELFSSISSPSPLSSSSSSRSYSRHQSQYRYPVSQCHSNQGSTDNDKMILETSTVLSKKLNEKNQTYILIGLKRINQQQIKLVNQFLKDKTILLPGFGLIGAELFFLGRN